MTSHHQAQEALAALLREAEQGRGALALLQGPAGSGKSTLLRGLQARGRGTDLILASASRWDAQEPSAVLGPLLEQGGDPGQGLGPALLRRLTDPPGRLRVLVIDNAQWIDPDSLQAVRYAWRRLGAHPVLIVLALREEEIAAMPAQAREFIDDADAVRLHLPAPTPVQVWEIVLARLGIELPAWAARQLLDYTHGNLRTILELVGENPERRWEQWDQRPPATRALCEQVARTLQALDPGARELLEAAAVLGVHARIDQVVALTGQREPLAHIQQLLDAGLLDTRGHSGRVQLRFSDKLHCMAVYHQIQLTTRIRLHAAAAGIVDGRGAKLGHRADASLLPDEHLAAQLQDYAAQQGGGGEWSSAATAYFRAAALTAQPERHDALLLKAVDAIVAAGELPRAQSFSHRLSSLADSPERDVLSGYIAILQGRANTAERWLASAWQTAQRERCLATMAVISQRRVLHSLAQLQGRAILAWAEQSRRLSEAGSPLAVESAVIQGLGLAMMGHGSEGERELLGLLQKLPTGAQRQRAEMSLGWVYLATDRVELARHELSAASSTDYSEGSLRIALWARAWLARAEFMMGDWEQALETVRAAQTLQERSEIQLLRPLIQLTAVQIHAVRGEWELAEAHLAKAWAKVGSYPVMELPYRMARAEVAWAQSNPEEVLRALAPLLTFDRAQGIDEPGFWTWQDLYAGALVRCERLDEAEDFLRPLLQSALDAGHRSSIARFRSVRGILLAARGDIDAARTEFDQALRQLEGISAAYFRATIYFAYGQCLRRAGKRAECVAPLNRALAIFSQLSATVYIQRCTRELQASGTGTARREVADFSTLTAQELAVAQLVCDGASNRRVAEELYISTKTVQYHLTKIYAKLGVSTRTELAALTRTGPQG